MTQWCGYSMKLQADTPYQENLGTADVRVLPMSGHVQ